MTKKKLMWFIDIFRKKGVLAGSVLVRDLPPHKMYSLSLSFFRVACADAPRPFADVPPADSHIDEASVKKADESKEMPLHFRFERPAGYYYLDVGVIAYIERGGKMFAQVEHFFPMIRPCEIQRSTDAQIELVVDWPKIPLEELGSYGVVRPR